MGKIIKLTESDLLGIVKKVISESMQAYGGYDESSMDKYRLGVLKSLLRHAENEYENVPRPDTLDGIELLKKKIETLEMRIFSQQQNKF